MIMMLQKQGENWYATLTDGTPKCYYGGDWVAQESTFKVHKKVYDYFVKATAGGKLPKDNQCVVVHFGAIEVLSPPTDYRVEYAVIGPHGEVMSSHDSEEYAREECRRRNESS